MQSYNLIDQPWITCLMKDGSVREVGIHECLARARVGHVDHLDADRFSLGLRDDGPDLVHVVPPCSLEGHHGPAYWCATRAAPVPDHSMVNL